jgi:hypothetical protein
MKTFLTLTPGERRAGVHVSSASTTTTATTATAETFGSSQRRP